MTAKAPRKVKQVKRRHLKENKEGCCVCSDASCSVGVCNQTGESLEVSFVVQHYKYLQRDISLRLKKAADLTFN